MPQPRPVCLMCKNYQFSRKCEAFPDKIQDAIFFGESDHRTHVEGDNGIKFEPFDDELLA